MKEWCVGVAIQLYIRMQKFKWNYVERKFAGARKLILNREHLGPTTFAANKQGSENRSLFVGLLHSFFTMGGSQSAFSEQELEDYQVNGFVNLHILTNLLVVLDLVDLES